MLLKFGWERLIAAALASPNDEREALAGRTGISSFVWGTVTSDLFPMFLKLFSEIKFLFLLQLSLQYWNTLKQVLRWSSPDKEIFNLMYPWSSPKVLLQKRCSWEWSSPRIRKLPVHIFLDVCSKIYKPGFSGFGANRDSKASAKSCTLSKSITAIVASGRSNSTARWALTLVTQRLSKRLFDVLFHKSLLYLHKEPVC